MNRIHTFLSITCFSHFAKLRFLFLQPMCLPCHGWLIQLFDSPIHSISNCAQSCMRANFYASFLSIQIYLCSRNYIYLYIHTAWVCIVQMAALCAMLFCANKTSATVAQNRIMTIHMLTTPFSTHTWWNARLVCTKTQGLTTCDAIYRLTSSCPACWQLSVLYWQ